MVQGKTNGTAVTSLSGNYNYFLWRHTVVQDKTNGKAVTGLSGSYNYCCGATRWSKIGPMVLQLPICLEATTIVEAPHGGPR